LYALCHPEPVEGSKGGRRVEVVNHNKVPKKVIQQKYNVIKISNFITKKIMKTYFVYILKCSDHSYYTGFTNNLERRMMEHHTGKNKDCYTFDKRPLDLVWFETFNDVLNAIAVEKQIKGWTRRKKEALIKEDWDKLVLYAKNYTQYGSQQNNGSSTGSD